VRRIGRAYRALGSRLGRRGLTRGVVATVDPQDMLSRLEPEFVIDVGANRGQFALDVRAAVPNAHICSFEPISSEAAVFRAIFAEESHVALRNLALSEVAGAKTIHVSGRTDSSSLHVIAPIQRETFRGTQEVRSEVVKLSTLDIEFHPAELSARTFLKLDVQGHELAVLRGGDRVLDRIRWILAELSFVEFYEGQALAGEVIQWLMTRGFLPIDTLEPVRRGGRTLQMDVLFERAP
jgi:FkbM family methyltransferase